MQLWGLVSCTPLLYQTILSPHRVNTGQKRVSHSYMISMDPLLYDLSYSIQTSLDTTGRGECVFCPEIIKVKKAI
jgi:hypothetical protein